MVLRGLSRREFNASLLAGLVGLNLPGGDKVRPSVFGGIQIGVQSYTFRRFSIDQMIGSMKSIGLSTVELWDGHLHPVKATEQEFKTVKAKFDDAGIGISAYCVNFPVNSTDEVLDRGYKGALLLGTNVMTASVKKPIVARLDEWCRKYKVRMGLHNHWFGEKWFRGDRTQEFETPDDFTNAMKGASEYLGINLDIGHFFAAGFDPGSFIREHHRRIVSIHIKDRDTDEARTQRRFGEAKTPIAESMRLLKKLNYRFAANIEYELDSEDPTEGVRHALDYLKRVLS